MDKLGQSEVSRWGGDEEEVNSLTRRATPAEVSVLWGRSQFHLGRVPASYGFLEVTTQEESLQLYSFFGSVRVSKKVTFDDTRSLTRLYKPPPLPRAETYHSLLYNGMLIICLPNYLVM